MKVEYKIREDEFLELVESVGFKTYPKHQVTSALENTMYMVKVIVDNEVAGMGRVIGDGSIACLLSNICVKPKFQRRGIGTVIVSELKKMIEDGVKPGEKMLIELNATAGNELFYQKCGFKYKPDKIIGMYLWIKK